MADALVAISITLDAAHEGGFQKNYDDRANWTSGVVAVGTLVGTKYGITTLDMPGVDIENLTETQAVKFYADRYWKQGYSQIDSQLVANKLFDMGVLFGVGTAVRNLQKVLDVAVDGVFGSMTLAAVNRSNGALTLRAFQDEMCEDATAIAAARAYDAPDLADWIRRIDS